MTKSLNRRNFLKLVSAGTCGAAIHHVFSPLNGMLAFADPISTSALTSNSVMVIVNLAGGCSYNIAPPLHSTYQSKMPTTGNGNTALALNSEQGLHPSLVGLKGIYDEGRLALLNLVGYPNENRSHAEATDIWLSGLTSGTSSISGGWLSRLTCQMGGFLSGASLSGANTGTKGECNPMKAIGDLSNFGEDSFWGGTYGTKWLRDTREAAMSTADTPKSANESLIVAANQNMQAIMAQIQANTNITLPVTFPNTGFGNRCRDAAKLIAAGPSLGVRLIYMERGGFDTHADEQQSLTGNLNEVNGGLTALANCLKAIGRWNDVVVITMSEFSRTFENGSNGTDHGHAAPMILMGGSVIGGIRTPTPTPAETIAAGQYYNDSQIHLDFRAVFSHVISRMGYNPIIVFPEAYANTIYSNLNLIA